MTQRARQCEPLAEGFRASDDFGQGLVGLRLLPTPIARYGESGTKLVNGPFSPSFSAPIPKSSCSSRLGPASKDFNGSMLLHP